MNLALIGRQDKNDQFKDVLVNQLDNIKVETFDSIDSYVQVVTSRNWKIDRIIIMQDILPKVDTRNYLMRFQRFVDERDPRTSIVFIVRDLNVAEGLKDIFVSPFHCIIYTLTLNPPTFIKICSEDIKTVKEKYGRKTDDDSFVKPDIEVIETQKETKKKKGLLGSLFKKKSHQDETDSSATENTEHDELEDVQTVINNAPIEPQEVEKIIVPKFTDSVEDLAFDTQLKENMEKAKDFYGNDTLKTDKVEHTLTNTNETTAIDVFSEVSKPSIHETIRDMTIDDVISTQNEVKDTQQDEVMHHNQTQDGVDRTISVQTGSFKTENAENPQGLETVSGEINNDWLTTFQEEEVFKPNIAPSDEVQQKVDMTSVSDDQLITVSDQQKDERIEVDDKRVLETLKDIENKVSTIENIDVQMDTHDIINPVVTTPVLQEQTVTEIIHEVEVDFNVRHLETAYKEQENQKTQDVQIVDGDNSNVVQRGVVRGLGGRRNIIVTGDRCSGITSTALTLASMLARKEPTLYVDFDIEHKGFIYYCGVNNIIREDDFVQSGLVHLHRYDNIKSVTYHYHKGGFDTLLSFFDSEATDDDIKRVQKILTIQKNYKNVVIDCPIDKLKLLRDMIEQATILICTKVKLKNLVSTLSFLSASATDGSQQYNLYKNARFVLTDNSHPENLAKHLLYIQDLFSMDEEEIDWTDIPFIGSTQNMMSLLNNIVG